MESYGFSGDYSLLVVQNHATLKLLNGGLIFNDR